MPWCYVEHQQICLKTILQQQHNVNNNNKSVMQAGWAQTMGCSQPQVKQRLGHSWYPIQVLHIQEKVKIAYDLKKVCQT